MHTLEEEINNKIEVINNSDKAILSLRQGKAQLTEEISYELMEMQFSAKRDEAKRLEHANSDNNSKLETQSQTITKLKSEYAEMENKMKGADESNKTLKKSANNALTRLAEFKGALVRCGTLKSEINTLKLEFISLKTFVEQRISILPKLIRHISMHKERTEIAGGHTSIDSNKSS